MPPAAIHRPGRADGTGGRSSRRATAWSEGEVAIELMRWKSGCAWRWREPVPRAALSAALLDQRGWSALGGKIVIRPDLVVRSILDESLQRGFHGLTQLHVLLVEGDAAFHGCAGHRPSGCRLEPAAGVLGGDDTGRKAHPGRLGAPRLDRQHLRALALEHHQLDLLLAGGHAFLGLLLPDEQR